MCRKGSPKGHLDGSIFSIFLYCFARRARNGDGMILDGCTREFAKAMSFQSSTEHGRYPDLEGWDNKKSGLAHWLFPSKYGSTSPNSVSLVTFFRCLQHWHTVY